VYTIYIPTTNRVGKQHTYNHLPKKQQKTAVLVCPKAELAAHQAAGYNAIACPVKGIGKVRQWIIDNHQGDYLIMLDDDLRFDKRREDDRTKFIPATESDVNALFSEIYKNLKKYTHVGVAPREGGNRLTNHFETNIRMLRVLAYNVKKFKAAGVSYDRCPVMEDFDVTLQLLRKGHENLLLCDWVQGQGMSNAEGGCSTYRTMDLQEKGAKLLNKHHPQFVKLVTKKTKNAWNGNERTDVVIQWKKAYESSKTCV